MNANYNADGISPVFDEHQLSQILQKVLGHDIRIRLYNIAKGDTSPPRFPFPGKYIELEFEVPIQENEYENIQMHVMELLRKTTGQSLTCHRDLKMSYGKSLTFRVNFEMRNSSQWE